MTSACHLNDLIFTQAEQAPTALAILGPVTLFSASERLWNMRRDPMEKRKDVLTGPCQIAHVSGDHKAVLKPPFVSLPAENIRVLLDGDAKGS